MNKKLIDLEPGDIVQYTGLDGKYREITFLKIDGLAKCVRSKDYTLNFMFDWNGQILHAPLDAWLLTQIPYIIRSKAKQHGKN